VQHGQRSQPVCAAMTFDQARGAQAKGGAICAGRNMRGAREVWWAKRAGGSMRVKWVRRAGRSAAAPPLAAPS